MLYILGVQAKPKKNTYVGSQTRRRTTRQDGIRASGTEDSQREDSHSTLNKGSRKAIKTLKHLNKGVKHLPCWCTSACTLAHSSKNTASVLAFTCFGNVLLFIGYMLYFAGSTGPHESAATACCCRACWRCAFRSALSRGVRATGAHHHRAPALVNEQRCQALERTKVSTKAKKPRAPRYYICICPSPATSVGATRALKTKKHVIKKRVSQGTTSKGDRDPQASIPNS